jgi:enoyl-CoA hydratase/carnithine racemase
MLRIDDHGRVRVLTFDRPDALNAMNGELYRASADALDAAAADPGVSAVILTGTGRAFCAGQDLAEMGQMTAAGRQADDAPEPGFPRFADALIAFPKPLIAAVNGLAVGIGFTMLPHCDLVVVATSARFRTPFAKLGVAPEAASSVLFPMVMGWQAAALSLLTGEWLSADDAVAHGFALRTVADDELLAAALEIGQQMAALPVVSLVETKRLMRVERDRLVTAARKAEDEAFGRLIGGPANNEAIAAFLEKREPDFSGQPPA